MQVNNSQPSFGTLYTSLRGFTNTTQEAMKAGKDEAAALARGVYVKVSKGKNNVIRPGVIETEKGYANTAELQPCFYITVSRLPKTFMGKLKNMLHLAKKLTYPSESIAQGNVEVQKNIYLKAIKEAKEAFLTGKKVKISTSHKTLIPVPKKGLSENIPWVQRAMK